MILPAASSSQSLPDAGSNIISKSELHRTAITAFTRAERELHSVATGRTNPPDELVMGEKNDSSALTRIEQFNDNKTEQVWELFENEFRNASRSLDGELGWLLVSGGLRVEDVKKEMSKETVAKLVADVAMSSSSTVPFAASWISNKEKTGGQLTDAGVLL